MMSKDSLKYVVLALLILNLNFFTACSNNTNAQNGGDVTKEAVVPVGAIFSSEKDDGSGEFQGGSFEIDEFLVVDGNLSARGLLSTPSVSPLKSLVTLPVEIDASTCQVLGLNIGPPAGLLDPIELFDDVTSSNLTPVEFCDIEAANQLGDNDELVFLLNQEASALSCPWWRRIACRVAAIACAASCVVTGGLTCISCLAAIGASSCLPCM